MAALNLFGGNGLNLPPSGQIEDNGPAQDPGPSWEPPNFNQPATTPAPTPNPFGLAPIPIGQGGPTGGGNTPTPPPNPSPGQTTQPLPATMGFTPQRGARVTIGGQTFVGDGTNWTLTTSPAQSSPGATNTTTPAPNPFVGTNPFIPTVTSPTVNTDGSPGPTYNFATPGNPNLNYATQDDSQRVAQMFGLPMGTPLRGALPGGQASDPIHTVRLPNGQEMPAGQIIQWLMRGDSEADIRARLGITGGSSHLGGYGAPGSPTFGPLNRNSFQAPPPVPANQLPQVPETFLIPNTAIPQVQNRSAESTFSPGMNPGMNVPVINGQAPTFGPNNSVDPMTALLLALFMGQQPNQNRQRQPRLPSYGRTNLYPGI